MEPGYNDGKSLRTYANLAESKAISVLLAVSLVLTILPAYGGENVTVVVSFKTDHLPTHKISGKVDAKGDLERILEAKISALKEIGIQARVKDLLSLTIFGAVLELDARYVGELKRIPFVERVYEEEFTEVQLKSSVPLVGADKLRTAIGSLTGEGIKAAIIDTGVDYNHPDLGGGFGKKVVGGYDFVDEDSDPMDKDGHGTSLAGIVAADGALKGVAPKAQILAYRVLGSGRTLRVSNVVRALELAVKDGAKVVNLSLGSAGESELLRKAVGNVMRAGVLVVAAAGNFGPYSGTVSSPADESTVLAVGASMNNSTSSLVSVLELLRGNRLFETFPMNGTRISGEGVVGKLVSVKYARKRDVENVELKGAIAIAERGGEPGELVYFAEKEVNVAAKGAAGLIVYNNNPGPFQGTLTGPGMPSPYRIPNYSPSIPVVSTSREDGLELIGMADRGEASARLKVIIFPNFVAQYSSRGPNSPFLLKPDLVAPGSFINSTFVRGGYRMISGTSFAAPHVVGAAALLLQHNPKLTPKALMSILQSTSVHLKDPRGRSLSAFIQGSGRLDILNAVSSNVLVSPAYVILHVASGQPSTGKLSLELIGKEVQNVNIGLDWRNTGAVDLNVQPRFFKLTKDGDTLAVTARFLNASVGTYEGRLFINTPSSNLTIPIIAYINSLPLNPRVNQGGLDLEVGDKDLLLAQAKLTMPDGTQSTKTSEKGEFAFKLKEPGYYWLEVEARTLTGRRIGRTIIEFDPLSKPSKGQPEALPNQPPLSIPAPVTSNTTSSFPQGSSEPAVPPQQPPGSAARPELIEINLDFSVPSVVLAIALASLSLVIILLVTLFLLRRRSYEYQRRRLTSLRLCVRT